MLHTFALCLLGLVAGCCSGKPPQPPEPHEETHRAALPVSMESLLDEMLSFEEGIYAPSPAYAARQTSSTDARSVAPDKPFWFANIDNTRYVRMGNDNDDRRVEKVIFEQKGAGVVTRIWSPVTVVKAIRFYFDGERTARLVLTGSDFSQLPFYVPDGLAMRHTTYDTYGGTSLYLPLPYQNGLKITIELSAEWGFAYHINYRSYEAGTPVRTFTIAEAAALASKMDEVVAKLSAPTSFGGGVLSQTMQSIAPGSTMALDLPEGSCAVRNLVVTVSGYSAARYADIMRRLILRANFDGTQTVWSPLGDFSGGGIGGAAVQSYYLSANGAGRVECRFVMPYRESAAIEIDNTLPYAVNVKVEARTTGWEWYANTLYFHTSWRQERGLSTGSDYDSNDNTDWLCAALQGRGVVKGDALSLYNYGNSWYGEGDEKIWIDDDSFPSHFGTGIEDYYNASFAPVTVFHTPFGGAIRADEATSHGYNIWLRLRPLDGITFGSSLRFYFELLGWNASPVIFSSHVWWYGDLAASALNTSGASEITTNLP